MSDYTTVKATLARGWNTWSTSSVLSHVCLPQAFAVSMGIKERMIGDTWLPRLLSSGLIGRRGTHVESIRPGPRTYDGRYTELELSWRGLTICVQSATIDDDLVILVTPAESRKRPAALTVAAAFLWSREGMVGRSGDSLIGESAGRRFQVRLTRPISDERSIELDSPFLAVDLDGHRSSY